MSTILIKNIAPLPALVPLNAKVVAGDALLKAIEKLQGQINALKAP